MSCSVTATETLVKQPSEVRQLSMDFSNLMQSTESIDTISSISLEVRGGGTSDLLAANEDISGQTVTFWASCGTDNTTYRITIVIITDAGQTLEGDGLISVRNR